MRVESIEGWARIPDNQAGLQVMGMMDGEQWSRALFSCLISRQSLHAAGCLRSLLKVLPAFAWVKPRLASGSKLMLLTEYFPTPTLLWREDQTQNLSALTPSPTGGGPGGTLFGFGGPDRLNL